MHFTSAPFFAFFADVYYVCCVFCEDFESISVVSKSMSAAFVSPCWLPFRLPFNVSSSHYFLNFSFWIRVPISFHSPFFFFSFPHSLLTTSIWSHTYILSDIRAKVYLSLTHVHIHSQPLAMVSIVSVVHAPITVNLIPPFRSGISTVYSTVPLSVRLVWVTANEVLKRMLVDFQVFVCSS